MSVALSSPDPGLRIKILILLHQQKLYFSIAVVIGCSPAQHLSSRYMRILGYANSGKITIYRKILTMSYQDGPVTFDIEDAGHIPFKNCFYHSALFRFQGQSGIITS